MGKLIYTIFGDIRKLIGTRFDKRSQIPTIVKWHLLLRKRWRCLS